MDLLANEQINYLKSISMLSCFSEPLQSVHDGSTKSCFRNRMARYDFTFFFSLRIYVCHDSQTTAAVLLWKRWALQAKHRPGEQRQHVQTQHFYCTFTQEKSKLTPVLGQHWTGGTGGFLLVCFSTTGRQKMLKLAAEPCDSLTVLDWDFLLYVTVMCCNCGKHEPSPKAHPSGWISISCKQLFILIKSFG